MTIKAVLTVNQTALSRQLTADSNAAAQAAADRTIRRARSNVIRKRRVRTRAMANSYRARTTYSSRHGTAIEITNTVPYYQWQEHGRGPVVPVRARLLRFQPKGSRAFVFARRVRGVAPGNFLRDALRDLRPADFTPPRRYFG